MLQILHYRLAIDRIFGVSDGRLKRRLCWWFWHAFGAADGTGEMPPRRPQAYAAVAGNGRIGSESMVGKHDMAEVWRFYQALVGVAVGTLLFGSLSEAGVRLVLGAISVVFAAYMLLKPLAAKPISTHWALPAASVCGFTRLVAVRRPPLNLYLLPRKLPKETFIATCVVTFTAVNVIKLGPYLSLGEINMTSAWASLRLVMLAWVGVRSGLWLQSRVNEQWFYRLVILAMFLVGVNLIWQALAPFKR